MDKAINIIESRIAELDNEYNNIYNQESKSRIDLDLKVEHLRCLSKAISELKQVKDEIMKNN